MTRGAPAVVVVPRFVACLPKPLRVRAARRAVARLKHGEAPRGRTDPLAGVLLAGALLCSAALGFVAGGAPPTPATGVGHVALAGVDRPGRDLPVVGAATPGEPSPVAGESGPIDSGGVSGQAPARAVPVGGTGAGTRTDSADRDERAGDSDRAGLPDRGADTVDPADAGGVAVAPPVADALWSEIGRVQAEILRLRVLFRRLADVAQLENGEFDLELAAAELPAVREALDAREALELSIRALDPISDQSDRMASIFDERRSAHDRRVGGKVARNTVRTSGFGHRAAPLDGVRRPHRGVDLAGRPGTPIHALADGIVTWSGVNGAYGNLVEIEHGDGFRTRYAHNRSNLVALGERVHKGEVVATLGSSGRSTGPHVHVEVRRHGRPLDPARFVR